MVCGLSSETLSGCGDTFSLDAWKAEFDVRLDCVDVWRVHLAARRADFDAYILDRWGLASPLATGHHQARCEFNARCIEAHADVVLIQGHLSHAQVPETFTEETLY